MSIFFDFKTINQLIGDNYYRQSTKSTLEGLSQYNESDGVADIITNIPKAGLLIDDDYMSDINNMNWKFGMPTNRQMTQDTSKFTPDDWIRYISPLVTYALRETMQGMNTQRSYQKFIFLGVLVGLGKTPQEAINQVQEWQNTGASQLLKSGASTGGTTSSGTMGTGITGISGSTGTNSGAMPTSQVKQDTSKFTPDDWIRYISPLVTYALRETMQGMNTERSYQKFILLGVLVGLGKTPQESIDQVQEWQNTGASQLLKSGTSTGGTGIGRSTGTSGSTIPTRQSKQDTSKFTPDDWIRYITPLVAYSLRETTQGMNTQRAYQKFILLGVLVGLGKTPQEAINQVQEWQNTGASQLLKSSTNTGSTATSGSTGTGTGMTGTGASTGTSTGTGTGMTGTGTSTGTSTGTGMTGTGTSTGTSTGAGTGMTGTGTSTGTRGTGTSTESTKTSDFTPIEGITVLPPPFTTFKFASSDIDIAGSTRTSDNTNKNNRLYFE